MLAAFANLVWLLALTGAFAGYLFWQARLIERDTPPRE